ncbi:MAG: hypothetical protein HY774_12270 [Acidobacteria bacterium]|nr:hypothetical protein [Acidobacteriota bacterium]
MNFIIYCNGEPVGHSDLAFSDEGMGVRTGLLLPLPAYQRYAALFQDFSRLRQEHIVGSEESGPLQNIRAMVENLQLEVRTASGESIGTLWIGIEDFSDEVGDEGRLVTLVTAERGTYERFFGSKGTTPKK